MIYSMTGYGQAEMPFGNKIFRIELRSVNAKYNDVNIRVPSALRSHEIDLRKIIQGRLLRGKIQLNIQEEKAESLPQLEVNTPVLDHYWQQLKNAYPGADVNHLLPALLRLPDVWQSPLEDEESLWQALQPVLDRAMEALITYRRNEGQSIEADLNKHLLFIREKLTEVRETAPRRLAHIRERLENIVADLRDKADPSRLEQEMLYYMDKLDINEEIQRLTHHLDYFEQTLQSPAELKGKKLQFISQEMGREINTIGSKANDAGIQKAVVEMKNALDKIKEQTANVL